eukprot:4975344-Alexandrium_andersonii.AAC.1
MFEQRGQIRAQYAWATTTDAKELRANTYIATDHAQLGTSASRVKAGSIDQARQRRRAPPRIAIATHDRSL